MDKENASNTMVMSTKVDSKTITTTVEVSLHTRLEVTMMVNGRMDSQLARVQNISSPVMSTLVTSLRESLTVMVIASTRMVTSTQVSGSKTLLLVKESSPMLMELSMMVTGTPTRKSMVTLPLRMEVNTGHSIKTMPFVDPTSVNILMVPFWRDQL